MTLLGNLKIWAIAAAGAVGAILLALAYAFNSGRKQERADQILDDRKQEEIIDDRIQDAVDEGDRVADDLRSDDGISDDLRADDGFRRD